MSLFDNHLGIQVCKDRIRIVELTLKEEEVYLENVGEQKFDDVFESINELPGILHSSYRKIFPEAAQGSKIISFTFSPSYFKVFEVPCDNTLLKDDLKEHLLWELKKLFPYESDSEYLIQNIEYKKGLLNRENYTGVLALPKQLVASVVKFSRNNNMSVKYIDHPQTASNLFLKLLVDDFKDQMGLSVYIGADSISVMLISDGMPVYIKQHDYNLTVDISSKLKSILEELVYYDLDLTNIEFAYIAGESINEEIVEKLSGEFGIPIKTINPFEKIKISPDFKPVTEYKDKSFLYAAPAGLALRLL